MDPLAAGSGGGGGGMRIFPMGRRAAVVDSRRIRRESHGGGRAGRAGTRSRSRSSSGGLSIAAEVSPRAVNSATVTAAGAEAEITELQHRARAVLLEVGGAADLENLDIILEEVISSDGVAAFSEIFTTLMGEAFNPFPPERVGEAEAYEEALADHTRRIGYLHVLYVRAFDNQATGILAHIEFEASQLLGAPNPSAQQLVSHLDRLAGDELQQFLARSLFRNYMSRHASDMTEQLEALHAAFFPEEASVSSASARTRAIRFAYQYGPAPLRMLLLNGVIDCRNEDEFGTLISLPRFGDAVLPNYISLMNRIIRAGSFEAAVHLMTYVGDLRLLEQDANDIIRDILRYRTGEGEVERWIRELVRRGANLNIRFSNGRYPMNVVAAQPALKALMIELGAAEVSPDAGNPF